MSNQDRETFKRIAQIAHEHILFAKRAPGKASEIAGEMVITTEAAIAAAIADQVMEEFRVSHRKRDRLCLKT